MGAAPVPKQAPAAGNTANQPATQPPPPRWERASIAVLLLWFAARVAFLAFRMHPYVPPDEVTHLGRILAYAGTLGVPANDLANLSLGLLDHRPWLYYWCMARALAGSALPLSDLVFLRLVNGALATTGVWLGVRWMREWCADPTARVLAAALLTNTLMFTGLAAAVSYDNGANLLAAAALLAYTRWRRHPSAATLLTTAALLLAGCLTKRSFLPLAALFALLMVLREWRGLAALPGHAARLLRRPTPVPWALAAAVLVLAGFNAALYGGNALRFGTPWPGFGQVVGEAAASKNRIYARDRVVERFRNGEIDAGEARRLAQQIPHPGDRQAALLLLRNAQLPDSAVLGVAPYAAAWSRGMLASAVGYVGHRRALKPTALLAGYAAVFLAAAAMALWLPRSGNGIPADAAFLAVGYGLILMAAVHYPAYSLSRTLEVALQGRYLFPVWVPITGLVAHALTAPLPPRPRALMAAAVAAFFLLGDLPWLLARVGAAWFVPTG